MKMGAPKLTPRIGLVAARVRWLLVSPVRCVWPSDQQPRGVSNDCDFTAGSKVSAALASDPDMISLWQEREQKPSAEVIGPNVYRTVYGEPLTMPVLTQRAYQIPRLNLPAALKLLPEADEATDKKAVIPVFFPKAGSLRNVRCVPGSRSKGRPVRTTHLRPCAGSSVKWGARKPNPASASSE